MAITALNDYSIGDSNLNGIMTTLDKTYKGKAEITLSNYDADTAPVIKVGSVFEDNGALFIIDTSDITPTGYSGISNSTTFYLMYDDSASAFVYTSSAPTWSDALQGWYSGNDRYFFSMYKDSGGTLYQLKQELGKQKIPGSTIEDLTINNDLAGNTATYTGLVKWKKYYIGTSLTENALFDGLSSFIPTTGDFLAIHGQVIGGQFPAAGATVMGMDRAGASNIRVSYIDNVGNTGFINFANGDGTAVADSFEMMSNFDIIT